MRACSSAARSSTSPRLLPGVRQLGRRVAGRRRHRDAALVDRRRPPGPPRVPGAVHDRARRPRRRPRGPPARPPAGQPRPARRHADAGPLRGAAGRRRPAQLGTGTRRSRPTDRDLTRSHHHAGVRGRPLQGHRHRHPHHRALRPVDVAPRRQASGATRSRTSSSTRASRRTPGTSGTSASAPRPAPPRPAGPSTRRSTRRASARSTRRRGRRRLGST